MRRKIFAAGLSILALLFVIYPDIACKGAESGLMLWFNVIIPSLLPFMIISSLLIKLQVTGYISRIFYPVFHCIFGLSESGCYPAIVGMLSGYPLGAGTVGEIYRQNGISKKEAQYLLGFCNNASPMFMLEYVGVKCLNLDKPIVILLILYISAIINAWISRYKYNGSGNYEENISKQKYPLMEALDKSILSSAVTLTKVGGYIILFSIAAGLIQYILPVSDIVKLAGCGILEITTGCEMIAMSHINIMIKRVVIAGACAFGGFSSVAQTASVLIGTGLSMKKYLWQKFRQSLIAVLIALVVFNFLN